MAKVSPIQTSTNAGEFSPLMYGRVDIDKYPNALAVCLNNIPIVQGPVTRRPGTKFACAVKTAANRTRVVRFVFSTTQAYIIEFGNLYVRFYKDHGRIESPPGTAVEVATPYVTADIFALKFFQSADTLYIVHPSYAPRKLTRSSHTSWTLSTIAFLDGPYATVNSTATTMTPAATTGSGIDLTASSVTGVNGGAGFRASDVGRQVRLLNGSTWGYGTIVSITSTTVVKVDIVNAFGAAGATASWRLGLYNSTDGYPGAGCFFGDRLYMGGAGGAPQRIDGSKVGDYENMAPTETNNTVNDNNAVSFTLNSEDVQIIRWMLAGEKGLQVGTVSGEWIVRPSSLNEALTPTNVSAKQSTSRGSANIQAVKGGDNVAVYVQRSGRKLRALKYDYYADGFKSGDLTKFAEHITRGGVTDLVFQQEPQSIFWMPRADGVLLGETYEPDENVVGWHRHQLGGTSDAAGTGAKVESVAVIPSPDGSYDELWMVVQRWIGGAVVRYIEYMTKMWEKGDSQADAFFVDCGLTYSGTAVTSVSGLSHLEGETVAVLADGAAHANCVVTGGAITLTRSASVVQVGYNYNSDGQQLRNNAGAADGTAQGKTQRTHRMNFRVHETLGLKTGRDFDNLTLAKNIGRRTSGDLNAAVPLYTGDSDENWDGKYTTDNRPCWRFDQPFPGTVISIMPQQVTQDRG